MRSDETPGERPTYLFVVRYDDDAERKRVEYLFNNWKSGTIDKPKGLMRIAEGLDHHELYEELITKVPPEQVNAYRLDSVDPDVSPETRVVQKSINAPQDAVEPFLEYMLSKKKAVLQSAEQNEYEVYTKKGRADVSYQLTGSDGTTKVTVRITGHSPAPEFFKEFFETELDNYATSQS